MLQQGFKKLFSVKICFNGLLGIAFLQSRKWTEVFSTINSTAQCFAKASRLEHIFWRWRQKRSVSVCSFWLSLSWPALNHGYKTVEAQSPTHINTQLFRIRPLFVSSSPVLFSQSAWTMRETLWITDIYCTECIYCCGWVYLCVFVQYRGLRFQPLAAEFIFLSVVDEWRNEYGRYKETWSQPPHVSNNGFSFKHTDPINTAYRLKTTYLCNLL